MIYGPTAPKLDGKPMAYQLLVDEGFYITLKSLREHKPIEEYKVLYKRLSNRPEYYTRYGNRSSMYVSPSTFTDLVLSLIVNDSHGFSAAKGHLLDELRGRKGLDIVYKDLFDLTDKVNEKRRKRRNGTRNNGVVGNSNVAGAEG